MVVWDVLVKLSKMRISCSVVSYKNKPAQIAQVLRSVAASQLNIDLYLVDNSPDDQLAVVAQIFRANYIHLPNNPGFGAGHNVAIRHAFEHGSTYHLILNPDIHFSSGILQTLVSYMESQPDIGLIMPRVRYPDGQEQYLCKLLPSPVDLLMRRFFPNQYRKSGRLARYELHASHYDQIMDVPNLSGCFMLLRSAILRRVGIFDERFFMYLEDVDLSRRIGEISRTVYFPHVTLIHEYVKGSYNNSKLLFSHIRSAIKYFNKWGWFVDVEREQINRRVLNKLMNK